MTDEELKELVASIAIEQKETERRFRETDRRMQETDRQLKELGKQIGGLGEKFGSFTESLALPSRMQESDRRMQETDRQLKELGKQIGGLGEKFGSFTEGLALPSMQKILLEKFNMEVVSPSVRVSKKGEHLEIDVLAYANSEINEAYVVEVKSHPREEAIEQLRRILERFRHFFPEHKDKTVYGVLAAVDLSNELRARILKAGFYVARIHEQVFELDVPANFRAKAY